MKLRFLVVPMMHGEPAERELNEFLGSHRILFVERSFVPDGEKSAWAICVGFLDRGGRTPSPMDASKRVDYREILTPDQFSVFAKLRTLRKTLADEDGVPPYAIFTNEQLRRMVEDRTITIKSIREIPGVGSARIEKYGAAFIELLKSDLASSESRAQSEEGSTEASKN